MRKISDPKKIAAAVSQSKYREMLESLPAELFLTEYESGEYVPVRWKG